MIQLLEAYRNRLFKKTFTPEFIETWPKKVWTYEDYQLCHDEFHSVHEGKSVKLMFWWFLFLLAAAISLHNGAYILSGLFALLAFRAYLKSSQHLLMTNILDANLMLARLSNARRRE